MSRLPRVFHDKMNDEQRRLFEAITGGKRGGSRPPSAFLASDGAMAGPFNIWMSAPNIGEVAQRLGELLRFEGVLSGAHREIVILTVSAHYRAQYEWFAHAPIALREGVAPEVLDALRTGEPIKASADLELVVETVRELLLTGGLSDPSYAAIHALLGDRGTVELVAVVGYYTLLGFALNTFQVPIPEGEPRPFS